MVVLSFILKVILIFLIITYGLRLLMRIAAPFLFKKLLSKAASEAQRRAQAQQQDAYRHNTSEQTHSTHTASAQTKPDGSGMGTFTGGDYVEYEEIK
jgi:hypothetical protein